MALKTDKDGNYILKNEKDVVRALKLMENLAIEIAEIEEKHGIRDMQTQAVELKKAATTYCVDNDVTEIELGNGRYGKLIEQGHNRRWILSRADLSGDDQLPKGFKSLKQILKKKFPDVGKRKAILSRITTRTVNPQGIQELITEGVLREKDVAPAYIEDAKAPYLRIYGEADEE